MTITSSLRVGLIAAATAATMTTASAQTGPAQVTACTACHGANGVSVSADIPNLAGQKDAYLVKQLEAFKAGTRKNTLMNAIASQLSDDDIAVAAGHFAGLTPASDTQASAFGDTLAAGKVAFPADYKTSMTHYTTVNRADNKQLRHLYANDVAMKSARAGEPLADGSLVIIEIFKAKLDADGNPVVAADGNFEAGPLAAFTSMEKQPGWGDKVPAVLRNGNWNYAVYSPDMKQKPGVNQAKCLACHKPLDEMDYLFSYNALVDKAGN